MRVVARRRNPVRILFTSLILAGSLAAHAGDTGALNLARQLNEAFVSVAETVSPAVVIIDIAQREDEAPGGIPSQWFNLLPEEWRERLREEQKEGPQRRSRQPGEEPEFNGQGSGMIISAAGDILTNNHVVEGAEALRVRLRDGRQFEVEVKGSDSDADLAVLRIKDPPKDLPVVTFADSDRVRVGEFAIAIGAPYRLDYSVSFGHVSAKGRSDIMGTMFDQDFIQTDANINPGNSGGPLVDIEGRVIGVNSMIRGLNSGIGFAIPSNLAREIANRLIDDGRFVRSWLGLGIGSLRDEESVKKRVPDLKDGVVVTAILPNGPSSRAEPGLEPSDVITAVDGHAVATPADLRATVSRKRPGSAVVLDIRRAKDSLKIRVTPEALPSPEERFAMATRRGPRSQSRDPYGLRVIPLEPDKARELEVESGVVLDRVSPHGIGAEQDLQPGDVIMELNQQALESPEQFEELLKKADLSKGILLHIQRDGEEGFRVLRKRKE